MENISHSEITIHAWIRHVLWDLKEQRKSRIFHGIMSDMSSKLWKKSTRQKNATKGLNTLCWNPGRCGGWTTRVPYNFKHYYSFVFSFVDSFCWLKFVPRNCALFFTCETILIVIKTFFTFLAFSYKVTSFVFIFAWDAYFIFFGSYLRFYIIPY